LQYGKVKTYVEEPANPSSTLKMEGEGIFEKLVPFYKLLWHLVLRIPQYFKCCRNFRFYEGMSHGKLTCNNGRTVGDRFILWANTLFSTFVTVVGFDTVLTAHLYDVANLKYVQLNSQPLLLLVVCR
jgi:hypothetical protein